MRAADALRLPLSIGDGPGLRKAQVAAAHAIVAHFWASSQPAAIVVMPTGSGKTAVMALASLLLRPTRVLVIAPSRLVREQIAEQFAALAPLREAGALDKAAPCPKVIEQTNRITNPTEWEALRSANIVVALPHSASPSLTSVALPPADLFDLVLVDEAHHAPAQSYQALLSAFPAAKKVLFTATPFRRDEREIPGELVFTYHLAQARRDGVFGQLRFAPVQVERDASPGARDEAIARAAARQLEADREAGLEHRLLVRAASRERADELALVYERVTQLKLRRIHSGLSQRWVRTAVNDLRSGTLDGIIAVDMLGEGFDLPNLKVAALHARHRSLAVTLQFIGRFARTSNDANLGPATFFAVPDELEREAEALYVPGAEWNEIVETLSRDRIESERHAREFVQTFASTDASARAESGVGDGEPSDDNAWRLLRTLRPYFHVKVYDALGVPSLDTQLDVPDGLEALVTRHSKQHNALIWVGRERQIVRWSSHEGWVDVKHEMFLLVHVPDHRLLFVCSSCRESSVYDRLVSSVLGDQHRRLATSEVNRVLRGISAPEFFSLGMRNRAGAGGGGAESYRMLAGRAADRAVRAADSAVYDQGHGFCRGEEDGTNVTIGFSSGSKVWANRRDGLNQFVAWMHQIAAKLRTSDTFVTGSGIDKLNAARRIERYNCPIVYGDLPPNAYVRGDIRVQCDGVSAWLTDLAVRVDAQSSEDVDFALTGANFELPFKLSLTKARLITALGDSSEKAMLSGDTSVRDETLTDYLNEHPIVFYLENLARVDGIEQHDPPKRMHADPITTQIVAIDWAAGGVDPYTEKPARGVKRSLFEYVEARLLETNAQVVFLDDGAGEIADYISIEEKNSRILVQVFHCKAANAGESVPNQRISNLYEVAGQAVKCRRFLDARRLTEQLEHRRGLKNSTFKRGDMHVVRRMLADPSRISFQVVVVQPALSTQPSEPIIHLLEAADAYMRGADQLPLLFWGAESTVTPKAE